MISHKLKIFIPISLLKDVEINNTLKFYKHIKYKSTILLDKDKYSKLLHNLDQ